VNFLKTELNYLGHVTDEGGKSEPGKVMTINNFPIPKNTAYVKSFLGVAEYYRKFISQFSNITKPLTELFK
jgi:hypothetical protein